MVELNTLLGLPKDFETELSFEVLSLFPEAERDTYKRNFLAAANLSGELT